MEISKAVWVSWFCVPKHKVIIWNVAESLLWQVFWMTGWSQVQLLATDKHNSNIYKWNDDCIVTLRKTKEGIKDAQGI